MGQSRATRTLRGVIAAALATFVALIAHVLGGGQVPGWLGIVAPLMLSVTVSTLLSGRRLNLVRLSISVAASQLLFHTLFVVGASGATAVESPGHQHGSATLALTTSVQHAHFGAAMWLGHAVAAVITIAALYFGERTLLAIAAAGRRATAWLLQGFTVPTVTTAAPPVPRLAASTWKRAILPFGVFATTTSRRGPPLFQF